MIQLLDGSIGRELSERGADVSGPLWSANVLMKNKDLLLKLYEDYIDAGSTVLTTNTYGLKPHLFESEEKKRELSALYIVAMEILKQAIKTKNKNDIGIAISFPPLRSTYNVLEVPDEKILYEEYSHLFEIIKNFDHMCVIVETLTTLREAEVAIKLSKEYQKKIWISFTLKNYTEIRGGEKIESIPEKLGSLKPDAVLFNCCRPEYICEGIKILFDKKVDFLTGGYANRFNDIDENYSFEKHGPNSLIDLQPEQYLGYVKKWITYNASIIGGCCGMGPDYIKSIYDYLHESRYI